MVSRLAIDQLRSARARREAYVGPWLPEPIVDEAGPQERAEIAEDLSLALLVVLESLSASERVAFVLHDVFGYAFDDVAGVLGATPQAARQQAARARKAVEARRPRFPATPEQQREIVEAFVQAALGGDMEALIGALDPDVVFTSDGGGRVSAARHPVTGADRVARLVKGLVGRGATEAELSIVDVNGMPGMMSVGRGETTVAGFTIDDGRIVAIDVQRNPEKLRGIRMRP
jgi:RNA polymerase sigma-70 factor (ECF subfamily)